jgi:hypothetical protein
LGGLPLESILNLFLLLCVFITFVWVNSCRSVLQKRKGDHTLTSFYYRSLPKIPQIFLGNLQPSCKLAGLQIAAQQVDCGQASAFWTRVTKGSHTAAERTAPPPQQHICLAMFALKLPSQIKEGSSQTAYVAAQQRKAETLAKQQAEAKAAIAPSPDEKIASLIAKAAIAPSPDEKIASPITKAAIAAAASFGNRCNFAHGSKELSLALSFAPPSGAAPAAPAASQNIGWCSRNPVPWNRKSLPSYSENGITIFVDENGNTKRAAKEAGLRPF